MKYGNISYDHRKIGTIGDDMQLLAIENLYHYMGISSHDIIHIKWSDLCSYKGEYIVLPISFPLYGYQKPGIITQFSDKIIPVFLGLSILSSELSEEDICYLKRFSPIGCRDGHTLNIMRKYGILSYLNGCITASLPKIRSEPCGEKIFCVDLPKHIRKLIPESLLKDCVFTSHTYDFSCFDVTPRELTKKVYEQYIQEAKMIITTRLHAALPCAAAGIPVIFLKERISFRFNGIDQLIPIYSKEKFNDINWNPPVLEWEDFKVQLLNNASFQLKKAFQKYQPVYSISEFYEGKDMPSKDSYYVEFIDNTKKYIQDHVTKESVFYYALWGMTQTASTIYNHICEQYPHAVLCAVIDKKQNCTFLGMNSTSKDWLREHNDVFTFICTGAAIHEANDFFSQFGRKNYYQCCDDQIFSEDQYYQ